MLEETSSRVKKVLKEALVYAEVNKEIVFLAYCSIEHNINLLQLLGNEMSTY